MIAIDPAPRILGNAVIVNRRALFSQEAFIARFIPVSALLHQTQHIGGELSETDGAEAAGFNHLGRGTTRG